MKYRVTFTVTTNHEAIVECDDEDDIEDAAQAAYENGESEPDDSYVENVEYEEIPDEDE